MQIEVNSYVPFKILENFKNYILKNYIGEFLRIILNLLCYSKGWLGLQNVYLQHSVLNILKFIVEIHYSEIQLAKISVLCDSVSWSSKNNDGDVQ